jgi:ankyrin repeat protein
MLDIVRCLIKEYGADVNEASPGYTPLYVAVQNGHVALVECLVKELGANVHQATNDGRTPLHIATQKGNRDMLRLLVNELGADVNQATTSGATPLHCAVDYGFLDVARCLVKELGADVNRATTTLGATPVFIAVSKGNKEMVVCLVEELGADVNQAANNGGTPLGWASAYKKGQLVRYLLKNGANAQALTPQLGTAANISELVGAQAKQTAYLEARTHCANPGCVGAGLKKCAKCLEVYFCSADCQVANWPAHKADCKRRVNAKRKEEASN